MQRVQPDQWRIIIDAYNSGKTMDEVGVMTGFSRTAIRKLLIKKGVPTRKRGPRGPTQRTKMIGALASSMVAKGYSLPSLGRQLGISEQRLRFILARDKEAPCPA
jgi:hypothetical protein